MAKKSFKGGLGSLLESTFKKTGLESPKDKTDEASEMAELKAEIDLLKQELALWRTGELDHTLFLKSLSAHHLRYNAEANTIEKKEQP